MKHLRLSVSSKRAVIVTLAMILLVYSSAAACLAASAATPAEIARDFPKGFVYDKRDVLGAAEETALNRRLVQWSEQTSNQLAVLIVGSTGGMTAQQYSFEVAELLGVGNKDKDNGILLFIAIDNSTLRSERDWRASCRMVRRAC